MKHLLFVNTYYYPNGKGGAEKSTQILAESFVKKNYKVSVITSSNENTVKVINGVIVYFISLGNIYWLGEASNKNFLKKIIWHLIDSYGLNNTQEFEKIVSLIRPDIVITNNLVQFSSKIWKYLFKLNLPIVHIIRDHYQISLSTTLNGNEKFLYKFIFCDLLGVKKKFYSNYVNVVIGISNYILQKHISLGYFKNSQIRQVIHNPVIEFQKPFVRKKNMFSVFGYVGALNADKGVDLLLENFSHNNKINLFLFGTGKNDYIKKVNKYTSKFPNIKFLGYEDHFSIFSNIDVLIVPSLINEAFGRVIIEAYSFGIPVIGSNKGGIPELIDVGSTGFLFDPEIKFDLLRVIKEYGLDTGVSDTFIRNCKEKSKNFYPEVIMKKYIEILNNI